MKGFLIIALLVIVSSYVYKPKKYDRLKMNNNIEGLNFNDIFEDDLTEVKECFLEFEKGHTIPSWLKGTLIRNGPAVFGSLQKQKEAKRYTHIFDGIAKLSSFEFKENGIIFKNKFIKSSWYNKIVINKEDIPPSITTGPVKPPFSLIENIYSALTSSSLFDNVPVNIHQIGGNGPVVATTDAPIQMEFNPNTLETIKKVTYRDRITYPFGVELFSTAHPHYYKSNQDQKIYTINYFLEMRPIAIPSLPPSNIAHIVKINSNLERKKIGSVMLDGIPYVHDFSVTKNYAILIIYPLYVNVGNLLNGNGFLPQLEWKQSSVTKIYVFDLSKENSLIFDPNTGTSNNVYEFETDAIWAYHHVNAFETLDNEIVVDINGYKNADIVTAENGFAYLDNIKDESKRSNQCRDGNWYRIKINLQSNKKYIKYSILPAIDIDGNDYTVELLTTNDNTELGVEKLFSYGFTGFPGRNEKNQYGKDNKGSFIKWSILKMDHRIAEELLTKKNNISSIKVWSESSSYPSEPVFVSKYDNITDFDHDDGVVLSVVYDGKRKESFLLVLDAKSMKEIGRCYLKTKIPFSFHGKYFKSFNN